MIKNKIMAKKKKDIKKLTDVVINDDEVIGKVTEVVSREELYKTDKQITGAIQKATIGLDEDPIKSMSTTPLISVPESMKEALANKDFKKPENYTSPMIGELISQILFTKEFTCTSIIFGSKGAKKAVFYQKLKDKYDRNKPLVLFFEPNEECKFEAGKKYNFIISE